MMFTQGLISCVLEFLLTGCFVIAAESGHALKFIIIFFFFNEMYTPIKIKQTYFSIKKDVLPYFF